MFYQEAECEKSAMDIKYNTDTKIEDNARLYQLQKANFDQEVNTAVSFIPHILFDYIKTRNIIYPISFFFFYECIRKRKRNWHMSFKLQKFANGYVTKRFKLTLSRDANKSKSRNKRYAERSTSCKVQYDCQPRLRVTKWEKFQRVKGV